MDSIKADVSLTFKVLNEFRKESKYIDVTIRVQKSSFPCHRLVLAASCKYFDALFGGGFQESNQDSVTLNELDADAFGEILEFIYAGTINITPENAYNLLKISHFLNLQHAEDICIKYIKKCITVDNLLETCVFTMLNNNVKVHSKIVRYMANNFISILNNDSFLDFPIEILEQIFYVKKRKEPQFFESGEVFYALLNWLKRDMDKRRNGFHRLFKFFPIPSNIQWGWLEFIVDDCENVLFNTASGKGDKKKTISGKFEEKETLILYADAKNLKGDKKNALALHMDSQGKLIKSATKVICPFVDNLKTICVGKKQYFLSYRNNMNQFWFDFYDESQWLKCPPVIFRNYTLAQAKENVYLCGKPAFPGAESNFFSFNCELNSWFELPACHKLSQDTVLVNYSETQICAFSNNMVRIFDHRSHNWYTYYEQKYYNTLPAVGVCDRKVYLSGGYSLRDESYCTTSKIHAFKRIDFQENKTDNLDSMKEAKADHVLVLFNNQFWALERNLNGEIYDFASRRWRRMERINRSVNIASDMYTVNELQDAVAVTRALCT